MAAAWALWRSLPDQTRMGLAAYGGKYSVTPKSTAAAERESAGSPTSVEGALRVLKSGISHAFVFLQPSAVVPLSLVQDRHVVFLDIHLEKCLREVTAAARSVLVIDHHRSGEKLLHELAGAFPAKFQCVFDTAKSGAQLAWEQYQVAPCPPLIAFIADRDLWEWKLDRSREINETLYVGGHMVSFGTVEALFARWNTAGIDLEAELAYSGQMYFEYQKRIVEALARRAAPMTMTSEGKRYNVLVVNSGTLASELGNYILGSIAPLFETRWPVDFVAIWSYDGVGRIFVSCRASRPGIDLSVIATNPDGGISGGGHMRASAFSISGPDITKVFQPVTPITAAKTAAVTAPAIVLP